MKHWIVDEICPHCNEENHYLIKGDKMTARCGSCGRVIVLCDKCEQMGGERDCANCKWCKVAEKANRKVA